MRLFKKIIEPIQTTNSVDVATLVGILREQHNKEKGVAKFIARSARLYKFMYNCGIGKIRRLRVSFIRTFRFRDKKISRKAFR